MWLAAIVVLSFVSCVDDNLTETLNDQILKELPALAEQQASVEASLNDVKALQGALKTDDVQLSGAVKALEAHIALLKGASVEKGTLATLDMQKTLAGYMGAAEARLLADCSMDEALSGLFKKADAGIRLWLGESFSRYYPVAVAGSKVNAFVAGYVSVIEKQELYVDALVSDVEAGLRKDERPEELTALAAAVAENSKAVETLASETSSLATEMETGYRTALQAAVSNPSEFDAEALSTLNSTAEVEEVDNSLTGLIARIESCEEQLADIIERLGVLEENMAGLLELIQSVTFMSSTSSDKACAYYNLVSTKFTEEGYMYRQPVESLELSYVVRPAASSTALTDEGLWNQGLKVLGYYAGRIEQAAVSAQNFEDFEITGVTADQLTGVVTVTVKNTLSEDFYFKKTGAKMALSVATGKTDLTSKFVEVMPMDETGGVYVETLSLSTDYVEVDRDLTYQLRATLAPEDATEQALIWTSSSDEIAVVSGNGLVTAKAVGEAVITVTTKGINEWGQTLSKSCKVKVLPNIKLVAPTSIEVGGTLTIRVDSPDYIDPQYIKWSSSNSAYASVNDEGVVTGVAMSYNTDTKSYDEVYITCQIGDYSPLVLTHTLRVVAVQPVGVRIPDLADDVAQKSIKIGEEFSLGGTIIPDKAAENFRLGYVAAGGGNSAVADIDFSTGDVSAKSPGSVTFIAQVQDKSDTKYYYPIGSEVWRFVTVNVEPYWVTGVTLPETLTMNQNQTATLTPVFTSDTDGVQPTYTDLKWTSSDPSIVSVDENTGELISHDKVGAVTITAQTSNDWSVPAGAAGKSATCVVSVKQQAAAVNVGDYYYSDGTWSTDLDGNKTVVGIVFSTTMAISSDTHLLNDHPNCSNGLVVGLNEYSVPFAREWSWSKNDMGNWLIDNGYTITATDKVCGYGNTTGYKKLNEAGYVSWGYTVKVDMLEALSKVAAAPAQSSGWYIPSYKEMSLIYENLLKINSKLTAKGTQISTSGLYYISTLFVSPGYYYVYYFNMSGGGWNGSQVHALSAESPVRVVLAF